ncbi:MAG: CDP-alcohol phosphatidyltransferase family protein [Anaerolineaceae bacterium]|nr:CDP-alcohol phosphatidyltransferase family protein [Anaerolineaceae bacterium]
MTDEKKTLTDHLRPIFQKYLDGIAKKLLKIGLTPNAVTIIGCLGNIIAAVLIAQGYLTWGGLVMIFWVLFDAFDGSMARLSGTATKFGAFLDSTLDRYTELFILGGLLWYFMQEQNKIAGLLTFITAGGSLLVSYSRARAQSLGFEAKIGLLSRLERFMILVPGLLFHFPVIAMGIMAFFTNLTALQRILHVYKTSKQSNKNLV